MTEQEALSLMNEGAAIDQGEAVHQEAAADGRIDPRGQIIEADPDAAAREWFLIPKIIAWAVTTVYPQTAPAYTDDKCMELARAIVPVAQKYGVNGMGDSPELMLLMGCGMFGAPAYLAHKARQNEKAQAEAEAKKGTAQDKVDRASNGS